MRTKSWMTVTVGVVIGSLVLTGCSSPAPAVPASSTGLATPSVTASPSAGDGYQIASDVAIDDSGSDAGDLVPINYQVFCKGGALQWLTFDLAETKASRAERLAKDFSPTPDASTIPMAMSDGTAPQSIEVQTIQTSGVWAYDAPIAQLAIIGEVQLTGPAKNTEVRSYTMLCKVDVTVTTPTLLTPAQFDLK